MKRWREDELWMGDEMIITAEKTSEKARESGRERVPELTTEDRHALMAVQVTATTEPTTSTSTTSRERG